MAQDRYEEWKELGRPDGSYDTWLANQGGGAPAPQGTPPPTGTPAPAQGGGGSSPFSDPTATQEYNRLVAAGENPTTAANIVRNALFGVEHDWQAQGGDKGQLWGGGGPLQGRPEDVVNQYRAWEKDRMPGCPPDFPYKGRNGQCAEKPDDCPDGMHVVGTPGKCVDNGPGEENLPKGPNSGAGATPPPAQPTTFGSQLSMTGNPLQDMLIGQFNSGQDSNTYQNNIFALGEDMRVGGAGRNADQGTTAPTRQGQSLSGGGLWWGQDKETFSGFDASKKNAEGTMTASPAARTPAPVDPTPAAAAPPPAQVNGPARQGGSHISTPGRRPAPYQGFQAAPAPTPMTKMVSGQFNSPSRIRPTYF